MVKTVREGNKVRQHTLYYLGKHPTVESALAALEENLESLRASHLYHLRCNLEEPSPLHEERIARLREERATLEAKRDSLQKLLGKL